MSLKKWLEQVEHLEQHLGRKSHSRKDYKKFRNHWLRRTPVEETPNTKIRYGWEY